MGFLKLIWHSLTWWPWILPWIAAGFRGAVLQIVRAWRMELGASIMCVSRPRVLCLTPEMHLLTDPGRYLCQRQMFPTQMFISSRWSIGVGACPACTRANSECRTSSVRYSALGVQSRVNAALKETD